MDFSRMFKKHNISSNNMSLDFQVRSFDLEGNEMDPVIFKPMPMYIDKDNIKYYGLLDKHLDKYAPVNRFCDLDTHIMAYHANGSSLDIDLVTTYRYRDTDDPKKTVIMGPDTKCLLKESMHTE